MPATLRAAFSLLEVVLALAILTMALTFSLGLVDLGTRGARGARDQTRAQELAESVLSLIVSGVFDPTEVAGDQRLVSELWSLAGLQYLADEDADLEFEEDQWYVTIATEQADVPNMLKVAVTVSERQAAVAPLEFTLVRWLRDPAYLATLGQQTTGGTP